MGGVSGLFILKEMMDMQRTPFLQFENRCDVVGA